MTTTIAKKIRSTSIPRTEYGNSAAKNTNTVEYKSAINKKNLKLNLTKISENTSEPNTENASQNTIFEEKNKNEAGPSKTTFLWSKKNHKFGANNSEELINKVKINNEEGEYAPQVDGREPMEISPPSEDCFDDDDDAFITFDDFPGMLIS